MIDTIPQTTAALAISVLRKNAAAFAEQAPRSRADGDVEPVHQTRVATRRMRAALRVFADVMSPGLEGLDEELKWIAGQLGPVRDLDVQAQRLRDAATALGVTQAIVPFGAWLEDQRQRAVASLDDALASQRFLALMKRLQSLDTLAPDPAHDPPTKDDAPPRLKRAYRRLSKSARDLDVSSPPTAFHKARIRGKRFRYTVEFLEPIYGKPAQRLIKATVTMQDLLGDHQDGVVSTQLVHQAVQAVGGAWCAETSVALGRLVQWELQRGEQLRRDFAPTYLEVRAAWQRLRRAL